MPDILNRPTTAEERRDASVAARQKAQYQKWDKRAQEADQSTWTVVTSSGDSYELSTAQVEWIRSRYKVNWEYDDSSTVDSYNKSRGYMPSNTLSTYNNTEYDKVLYESGLPSSSNLADYIKQYNEYYSLTSGQLQLSDDVAAWIRDRYKQDWEYDSLDSDDTKRQKNGEMPVSLDGNYANTNLDDYLRLQGLPSYANMQKYIDYYNEYVSANRPNEFYQDVWVSYNNLELIGIQNTDDILTSDQIGAYAQASGLSAAEAAEMLRSGITGAELYSKAFYDPLSGDYADIADRLVSPQKPSDDDDDDGIGAPAYDDAQKILDEQKAEARREKAASGKTVDYDYFMENFDSFGDTSQILSNGMTLEEGLTSARTIAAQEAENAAFAAFDEKADVDDYVRQNADLGYSELLERFYAQYAAGNVSWAYVRRAKNQLLQEASKEDRAAIRALWDDIQSRKKDEDVRLNVGGEGFFGAGKLGRAQAYISAKYEEYDPSGMMPDMTAETLNTIYNDLLIQGASEATIQAFSKQMSALLPEDSEAAIENAKWTNSTSSQMRATANKNLKLFSEDYFSDNEATSEGLLQVATEAWDKANIDGSVTVDEAMAIFQNAVADGATTEQLDELAASLGFAFVGQINLYGSSDVGLGGDDTLGVSYYPIGSTKTDWTSTERLAFHEQYYALRDGAEMVSNAEMIREWLVQIESSEAMSSWQAFQTVSRAGYGDVLSTYFADEWNRAYFTEKIVPSLVGASNSELADWWLDSETTDEDRLKFAQGYYDQLSSDEREAYSITSKSNSVLNSTYQYKLNPDVNKPLAEQIGTQIETIIPKVFSGIASGTVGLADLMFGWIGQDKRDGDLWQLTKDLQQLNADITNYGRSTSQGTGARLVSTGSDVVSEVIRMYLANYAGKALGVATGLSTKASKEGASALAKIAAYAVESAPFVSEAMGNYFIEAYQGGASRGEAMAYGVVLGTLEGAIEKLSVDSWLGKRMGSSSFGKTILAGTNTKGMSVVAKAKLASLVIAFLGEFAEEDISYIASTIWQSAGYGRQEGESFGEALSRQWSWSELFEQGVMGGLVGLFGAGVSLGGITASSILTDYMVKNGLSSEQMDLLYALTSWDSMSTAEQVAFSERAVKSLSLEDYNGTYQNYKDTTNAVEKAPVTLQSAIASESRKVANKQNIVDALVTEQSALGAVESLSTEDLQRWSTLAGNLATAQGELNTQLEQSRAAVATAQATYKATMTNAQAQNTASYNKLKEHYAATAMAFSGDIEAIRTSLAATRIESETTGKAKDLLDALNNNYLASEFSNLSDADIDAFIAQSIESSDLNSTLASAQVASATAKARLDSLNARLNLMKGSTTVVDVADASVLEAKEAEQRKAARAEAVSDKTSAESDVKEDISSEASKTPSEAKTSSDKEMPATRSKAEIDSPETIEAAIAEGKAFVGDTGTKYKRVSRTNEDEITRAGKKLGRSVVWEDADYHKSGWYAGDNTLHLNRYQPESEAILSPQMIVFRHELTHSLEGTKQYEAYKRDLLLLIDRIAARQGKPDTRTVIASMISERATLAEQMNDSTLRLTPDAAEREIVASYLNKMALSDETFIKRLVRASDIGLRGLAGRMLNRISFAIQRFGRNNADKLLIEAEQMYLDAFRAKLKQEKAGSVDKSGNTQYNISTGKESEFQDEFRRIQEASVRMSDEELRLFRSGNQKIDDTLRGRLSQVFTRKLGTFGVGGVDGSRILTLSAKGNNFELYQDVDGELFHDIFEIARRFLPKGERVFQHDDYVHSTCKIANDGMSGFAITKGGNLISVYNLSQKRGFLQAAAPVIRESATCLDCFVSPKLNLQTIYSKILGFKTASLMDYNMKYDHDGIARNHNMPDVAFMVNTESDVPVRRFAGDQYDAAAAYQQSFVISDLEALYETASSSEEAQAIYDMLAYAKGFTYTGYRGGTRRTYSSHRTDLTSSGIFLSSSEGIAREFGRKHNGSVDYAKYYFKSQNPLVLDAQGRNYNDIPVPEDHPDKDLVAYAQSTYWYFAYGEPIVSADWLGKWAREHGYDSVIISNVREGIGGDPETDYIVLDANNIKRADGEMFDEDGALIPASERLDDTTNGTYYSTGLTYDQLIQRYGAKRQGMDPRREDVQVPERTEVGRVPDLARTVLESQQYSESILGDVKDAIAAGEILSDTVSLKSSAQRARQEIKEAGAGENAAVALHKASNDLQTTLRGVVGRKNLSNTIAKTAQLLAEFSEMNDGAAFMDLLMATMEYSSEVGRALNAHKLFKLTGAKGAQYYAVKMAQQGNNIINELNEKTRRQEESRLRRKYANVDFGSDADADVGEGTGTGAGTDGTGNGTGDGTGAGTDAGTRTGAYAGTDTRTGTRTRAANQSGDMSAMERAIRRDLDAYMQQYGNLPIVVPMELFDALTKAEGNDQATADAVDNLLRAIGAQLPLTAMDKVNNWRYFSMLSNPITHARNIAGNIAMTAAVASKDVIASGLEKAAVRMGLMDDTERTHAAYSRNAQVDRVEAAKVLFERQRAEPWMQEGRYNYKSMLAKYKRSFDAKWLDALATFNNTALDKEDLFFSKRAFIDSATQFMVAQDLSADLSTWDEATLESVVNHAATESLKAVFRQPSEFARALQLFENSGSAKLFKQIAVESTIPFKKTPINIGKTMIAYSPLSILQGVYSATMNIIKKSDGGYVSASTVCDQFAKGIVGSALSAVGFLLASLGVLHGAFSDDEDEYMKALGYSEYSLTFGDVNIKINSIVPFSAPLFMGAMLYELAARDANESVDFGDFFDIALSVFDPIADMSFMSSINSVLEAYGYNGWGGVLGEMGSSITSQFLPSIGANTTRALEYTSRSTKASAASPLGGTLDYWWRSLARKIPLVSSAVLEPTVDIHGDVVQKDEFSDWALGFANAYLLPTSTTIANKNSIDEEIISVYRNTGNTGVLPASPRKYFTSDKVRYNLTASQYTEYSEEYGTYVYDQIANLIRKAKYKNADYDKKARLLADCISDAEDYIRDKWKAKIIED